jgi:hypothetical protein
MMLDGDTAAHLREQVGGLFFYTSEIGGCSSSQRCFRRLLGDPGAVVALVPLDQAGMASAVTVVMRQAGFAVGIAVLGAVLHAEDRRSVTSGCFR